MGQFVLCMGCNEMRKLLLLLLTTVAFAQVRPSNNLSYVASRYIATNYGQWTMQFQRVNGTTPGVATIYIQTETVTLSDGRRIMPLAIGAPLIVNIETVIPTAVVAMPLVTAN